jgi:Holliday junction resolvase
MDEQRYFSKEGMRIRSQKKEAKLARISGGKTTVNSGATFGDSDIKIKMPNAKITIEAKFTDKEQFILKKDILDKLKAQSRGTIPMMEIEIKGDKWYLIRPQEYYLLLELFENGAE